MNTRAKNKSTKKHKSKRTNLKSLDRKSNRKEDASGKTQETRNQTNKNTKEHKCKKNKSTEKQKSKRTNLKSLDRKSDRKEDASGETHMATALHNGIHS